MIGNDIILGLLTIIISLLLMMMPLVFKSHFLLLPREKELNPSPLGGSDKGDLCGSSLFSAESQINQSPIMMTVGRFD